MLFSFSHLPSPETFILGLFITCAFCELTSETSLVAPFCSVCSTSYRTGLSMRCSQRTRDWGQGSISQCTSLLPLAFSSKQISSPRKRERQDKAGGRSQDWIHFGLCWPCLCKVQSALMLSGTSFWLALHEPSCLRDGSQETLASLQNRSGSWRLALN